MPARFKVHGSSELTIAVLFAAVDCTAEIVLYSLDVAVDDCIGVVVTVATNEGVSGDADLVVAGRVLLVDSAPLDMPPSGNVGSLQPSAILDSVSP